MVNIMQQFQLSDRLAVVTGGAGQYGEAIVEALCEAGARTVIASRNLQRCQNLAERQRSQGFDVFAYELDQSNMDSIHRFIQEVVENLGIPHILVNNAVARTMPEYQDPIDRWEASMRANATGVFELTRKIVDKMITLKRGSIINISSIQGVVGPDPLLYAPPEDRKLDLPSPFRTDGLAPAPDYFFHKAGLISLTRYFASCFGYHNIRANCISPGGLGDRMAEEFKKSYAAKTFLNRPANREDIKGLIVFLASDASSYITGENILLDGGYVQK